MDNLEPKKKAGADISITYDTVRKAGYEPLVADYVQRVRNADYERLRRIIGLDADQKDLVMFHGTAPEKIDGIKKEGLKAFHEIGDTSKISVTPSPLVALWHVISNGPHDTLREQGKMTEQFSQDKPVLLVLRVPKDYLRDNPDSKRPVFDPESAAILGRQGERNTRLYHFYWLLEQQIANWKYRNDLALTGLSYPIDNVPTEYIYVKTTEGEVAISEYNQNTG